MLDSIFHRVSIRKWENKPVEPEKIEMMLRAAMAAPSARNQQPWEFYVITNKDKMTEIADACTYGHFTKDAGAIIVAVYHKTTKEFEFTDTDMALAMENMLIACDALGLGGCWIGTAPNWEVEGAIHKILDLPDDKKAYATFAFGYPAEEKKQQDRYEESRVHYIS